MSSARLFLLGGLLAFVAPIIASAQAAKPLPSYTDAEAAQHAGEEATSGRAISPTPSATTPAISSTVA